MRRLEDFRDRRGEGRKAAPSDPRDGARIVSLAGTSAAHGASQDFSENGHARRNKAEPERLELVWIVCRYSVAASGLERILEKEFRVHLGEEPPDGKPSSVVLYADSSEGLQKEIKRGRNLYPDTPILVFGPRADLPLAETALRAGARGFVHAEMTPEQLLRALEVVASKGEIVAPRELLEYLVNDAGTPAPELDALSPRQWEILRLVADGMSNAEIANHLFLSESTIKQHLRVTYKLLGVRNRAQAARLFRQDARSNDRSGS
jgi:DNA-binding NarL/FixJ family response regulator